MSDHLPWTPFQKFSLAALPENVWSNSRKCWRKTGNDDNSRNRNRSWGCSAVSSRRWSSMLYMYVIVLFFIMLILFWRVCSDGRKESGWCVGGDQREPGRLQQGRKDAPHSVITDQESRSVDFRALMPTGFLWFLFPFTAAHLHCVSALKYSNKSLVTFHLSQPFCRILVVCWAFYFSFFVCLFFLTSDVFAPVLLFAKHISLLPIVRLNGICSSRMKSRSGYFLKLPILTEATTKNISAITTQRQTRV